MYGGQQIIIKYMNDKQLIIQMCPSDPMVC